MDGAIRLKMIDCEKINVRHKTRVKKIKNTGKITEFDYRLNKVKKMYYCTYWLLYRGIMQAMW